jgi:CheY-like chemotaxis protein
MKKILIIDDEEIIIKSLRKLLEKEGYEVYVAKKGQDGIDMVEEEEFDLLVVDIRMPGMNGVDTVEGIYRVLEKKNKDKLPVIFITGYVDEDIEKRAQKLNPSGYIYKPFDIKEFVEKVKKILKD